MAIMLFTSLSLSLPVLPALPSPLMTTLVNTTHYRIMWTLTHTNPDQQASTLLINLTQPFTSVMQVHSHSL